MKKVRCIDKGNMSNLENGQIYEVELQYNDWAGEPLYRLKGVAGSKYKSRFEDVIEPDFKVGDKVVFARRDSEIFSTEGTYYTIGKEYQVVEISKSGNLRTRSDVNALLYMPPECFDLAPEPKPEPKFKVGDKVRITKENIADDKRYVGRVGTIVKLVGDDHFYLDGIGLHMNENQLELVSEPKPIAKEQTTVKKVKCIDALFSQRRLKANQIYEVTEGVTPFGTKFYTVKGVEGTFLQSRFEDVVEPKYNYGDTVKLNDGRVITVLGEGAVGSYRVGYGSTRLSEFVKEENIVGLYTEPKYSKNKVNNISDIFKSHIMLHGYGLYVIDKVAVDYLKAVSEEQEKYPQIMKFGSTKVVFNPPYTIMSNAFTDKTGKAKCNPKDNFDKWTGFELAYKRMTGTDSCSK